MQNHVLNSNFHNHFCLFVYVTVNAHKFHAPTVAKVQALKILSSVKKKAIDQPESLPSQILKDLNPATVPDEVAAHLPDIPNIRQAIVRERSKRLPANPRVLEDLEIIPRKYSVNKSGDPFLLYDSLNDEAEELECGRIIIFATQSNLRKLFQCSLWSADATFKSSPSLFYELFTIMGAIQYEYKNVKKTTFFPLVFALLETKMQMAYSKVLEVILREARKWEILVEFPETVIVDFELGLINAILEHFGDVIRNCWFHLHQIVHRHIQQEGLQIAYADAIDASIRNAAHLLCAVAFVPLEYVGQAFNLVAAEVPARFLPIIEFFKVNIQSFIYTDKSS